MEKVKILLLAGEMDVGGIENQLMHLLRCANKDLFQIDFTSTIQRQLFYQPEMEKLGASVIRLPSTEGRRFFRYCYALYRVLRNGHYHIVHSHELFHSGMVLLTARLAGVKHRFVHAHNWCDGDNLKQRTPLERKLYNKVMRRLIQKNATEFFACSTLAGKFLYGEKITHQKNYHLVFNSVDTSRYLDCYDQTETGEFTDDGWINVLQVGRFTAVKNQMFTVQIAAELKRRGKRIRILCAGNEGNEYERQVRAAIEAQALQQQMVLLGVRDDVDVLMRKASAFLLPSQYEGMPLVLIEAQAAGLPCVVADTFSHEVDFGLDQIHWLPVSEPAAFWADRVEEAVSEKRPEREAVAAVVREKGFDSKVFAEKLCELYRQCMK